MNNNKVFVGSLAWGTTDDSLRDFFAAAGNITSATVIKDRYSGRSKGFGFVEFSTPEEAQKAIDELNGKDLDGRAVNVSMAKPREDRPQNGGGYNGGDR